MKYIDSTSAGMKRPPPPPPPGDEGAVWSLLEGGGRGIRDGEAGADGGGAVVAEAHTAHGEELSMGPRASVEAAAAAAPRVVGAPPDSLPGPPATLPLREAEAEGPPPARLPRSLDPDVATDVDTAEVWNVEYSDPTKSNIALHLTAVCPSYLAAVHPPYLAVKAPAGNPSACTPPSL